MSMVYEVTGTSYEQFKQLKTFGEVERIDKFTINVKVEDEGVDDCAEWLERQGLNHRIV